MIQSADDMRRARLETLREECLALEATKDALAAQSQQLQPCIEDKRTGMSLLAPVHTLPEDVVIEILNTAYRHHFPHCRLDNGMPHTNSPVAISHVSRWWRRLALSIPTIWTCIHVTPGQHSLYDEAIKAYLLRSRELPISIFFLCQTTRSPVSWWPWASFRKEHLPRYRACWNYLLAERYRWKSCAIHADYEQTFSMLLKDLEGKTFPQLEYLRLSIAMDVAPKDTPPDFDAPKLLHLRMDSIPDISKAAPKIFANLTQLNLFHTSIDAGLFLRMLRQTAPTLQTLSLVGATFYQDEDPTIFPAESTLILPRLTHLILVDIFYDEEDQPNMCALLCQAATSLLYLCVDDETTTPDNLASTPTGLLLPTVRLLSCELSPPTTRESILAFPNLEMLQAYGESTETFTRSMEIDVEAGTSCVALPELTTLVLDDINEENLIAFVEHRARIRHPLKTLVLDDQVLFDLSAPTTTRLQELKLEVSTRTNGVLQVDGINHWSSLRSPWDVFKDKPIMVPWKNSTTFYDQFDVLLNKD